MKRQLLYLLLSLCIWIGSYSPSNAQTKVFLKGQVTNADGQALEMANVIAYSIQDSTISSFAITNFEGRFELELQQDSLYLLKAIYLGYADWAMDIQALPTMEFQAIQLRAADHLLDEITVVYEVPVLVRGDTISFDTDAFTTGKERKLKDVFEQLPGFEVSENGTVRVNGQKVDKITVDGQEFFTGDTKLATQNIPAKVVDKVKVLRGHSEATPLRSLDNGDGLAIDIQLKEDQRSIVFGSAEAGGGGRERYLAGANLFYFHPKGSINFIGNANNIGEQVFTHQDLFRFNGGLTGMGQSNGSRTNLSSETLGLVPLRDNLAQQNTTKVAAFNFSFKPAPHWQLSGYAIMTDLHTELLNQARRSYLGPQDSLLREETLSSATGQQTKAGIVKLQTKYQPSDQLHVEHQLLLKRRQNGEGQVLESRTSFADRYYDSDRQGIVPALEQYLNVYYTLGSKHLLAWESQQQWMDDDYHYLLESDEVIFAQQIDALPEDTISLRQDRQLGTQRWQTELTYFYLINGTNHLGISAGGHWQQQQLRSGLGQELENGTIRNLGQADWYNDLDYNWRDIYVGLHYKTRWGKLLFKPSLYWHDFKLRHTQEGITAGFNRRMILPALHARYAFRKSTDLTLNYSWKTEFYDAPRYARNSILKNYNHLQRGNTELRNNLYQSLQLNFYTLNLYNFTNLYGLLTYQRKYDHLNERLTYEGIDRISSPINIAQPNDWLTIYGALDKRFKKFKLAADVSFNYGQNYNSWTETELTLNENIGQQYSASVETRMENWPTLEMGFEWQINEYRNAAAPSQTYWTQRPFANVEVSLFKWLILTADYEFNWYQNRDGSIKSTYDLLNAELYIRKPDSPWELKLTALNLLNTGSIRQDNFSDLLISTSEYFIQQRYWLGTLKYEF